MLHRIFERTGETHYVDEAIRQTQEAVKSTQDNHPDLPGRLNNLGSKYSRRYDRLRELTDVEESVHVTRRAVDSAVNHPFKVSFLSNLGNRLLNRYERIGTVHDLEEAIQWVQGAIDTTPHSHHHRAPCLNTLGRLLARRYDLKEEMQDLERAIIVEQEAINSIPTDHADHAAYLTNLGLGLASRTAVTGDIGDLNDALHGFLEASRQWQALPLTRVRAAHAAIAILQELGNWNQVNVVAQAAVNLLPPICSRYANRGDQQYAIMQTSGLAADTGSILLKTGNVEKALEYMELGRGLILSYMIDDRSDWAELKRASPTLAERYETLHIKHPCRLMTKARSSGTNSSKNEQRPAIR